MDYEKGLLTVKSAAERLSVNPKTIRRWIKADKLEHLRLGRKIYTTERALDEFAKYSTAQAQTRRTDRNDQAAAELRHLLGKG
tara:strand:- start:260 stop:508 length:249 start_codon:yes stop_codon:yes gene_type:complete